MRRLREFFDASGFLEVETPLLSREIIPELHIEPIGVEGGAFLQASPELYMKRLLATGADKIFQLTRSFRAGERGQLHNPEFAIVEWYRAGDDMLAGIDLLDELTQSLLGTPPALRTSYAEAFERSLGISAHSATLGELATAAEEAGIAVPAGMDRQDRDEWLNLLLAFRIEPELGRDRPEIIHHYPTTQASLAKVV
ncbi:MAG: amino acid--tRNA ligase-related protein, partial [Burkholderiales bacterium]